MKNKFFTFLSAIALLSSLMIVGIFSLNKNIVPNSADSPAPFSITISQEQKEEYFNVNTDQNQSNITFKQANFASEEGFVTILKAKENDNISKLENCNCIHYMKSITVETENVNDVLTIEFDFDIENTGVISKINYSYNDFIMNGEKYLFAHSNPDSFRLINKNSYDIKIKSIVIEFYCQGFGFARPDASLYTYNYYESSFGYAISGFKGKNMPSSLIIPSEYDDGDHGKHPIVQILNYAFENNNDFQYLILPSSISVDTGAFLGKNNLKSVLISYGKYGFSPSIFNQCFNIEEYSLLSMDTSKVDSDYFSNRNMKTFKYSAQNYSITSSTFYTYSSLEEVIIGGDVNIYDNAFENCSSLTKLGFYDGNFSLGSSSFAGCSNLLSLPHLENVTNIGNNAFDSCSKITSFIPLYPSLSLGENCFNECSSLSVVDLRNISTSFGSNFLGKVTGLKNFYFNSNVSIINPSLFKDAPSLKNIYLNTSYYTEWSFSSSAFMLENDLHSSNNVDILKSFSNYDNPFVKVGRSFEYEAFSIDTNGYISGINYEKVLDLDTLVLPFCYKNNDSNISPIKGIRKGVFTESTKLKNIVIQALDSSDNFDIEDSAFLSSSVEEVTFEVINLIGEVDNFKLFLGDDCFKTCSNLTKFTTNAKRNILGAYSFYNCEKLQTFYGSNDLISVIGDYAFSFCGKLNSFCSKIEQVGFCGFFNTGLTSIPLLADSFTYFDSYSFGDCTSLAESIDFSDFSYNLEIKSEAFSGSSCKYIHFNPNSSQIILNKYALETTGGNFFEKVYFGDSPVNFHIYQANMKIGEFVFDTDKAEDYKAEDYIYFPINAFAMKTFLSRYEKVCLHEINNTRYALNDSMMLLNIDGPQGTKVDLLKVSYSKEGTSIEDAQINFRLYINDDNTYELYGVNKTDKDLRIIYSHPGGERETFTLAPNGTGLRRVEKTSSNSLVSIIYTYNI